VTTPDVHTTTADNLESNLARGYGVDLPRRLEGLIDRRVSAALEAAPSAAQARRMPVLRRRRRLALIPLLAAVFVVTAATAGGFLHFYEAEGGFAWQRAEQIGQTQVSDGFRITLQRAYADANEMMIALSIVDEQNRGSGIEVLDSSVTDSSGDRWQVLKGVFSQGDPTASASMTWFEPTPGAATAGRRSFTLTVATIVVRGQPALPASGAVCPESSSAPTGDTPCNSFQEVAVDASFSFDLTVAGGSEATPDASATSSDGMTVSVKRIVTSPSAVRLDIVATGLPAEAAAWIPDVTLRHNGQNLGAEVRSGSRDESGASVTVWTTTGVDDASGVWTVDLTTEANKLILEGQPPIPAPGPWTLEFSLP